MSKDDGIVRQMRCVHRTDNCKRQEHFMRALRNISSILALSISLSLVMAVSARAQPLQGGMVRPAASGTQNAELLVSVPLPQVPDTTSAAPTAESSQDVKATEAIVAAYLKKEADKKKAAEEEKKAEAAAKKEYDLYGGTRFSLQSLYDSLSVPQDGAKKWYEKLSINGYTQIRFGRALDTRENTPNLFGDRTINGNAENFLIRRARVILSGPVSEHLFVYIQPDFASTPQGSTTSTFFAQLRDLYADVYVDKEKVHRFRIGLSKVPYGFENLQSSQNRVPLDRTDAMNTAVAPNERDLGVIYYWTPEDYQKLFTTLVRGGTKGSNNFGIFALGVYDGQGGSVPEANLNLHVVSRLTLPVQLANDQVVEASIQGYTGQYVVSGAPIRPLGKGAAGVTPTGTGGVSGIVDQRIAATFVWFPQPFGFQAEWEIGRGPGLNDAHTKVEARPLHGGYVMAMYRYDSDWCGIFTPYVRYQQFTGGYRNIANAPYGNQRQTDFGIEWQIRKELELVVEYSLVNSPNFTALNTANAVSYRDFEGSTLRLQMQFNY